MSTPVRPMATRSYDVPDEPATPAAPGPSSAGPTSAAHPGGPRRQGEEVGEAGAHGLRRPARPGVPGEDGVLLEDVPAGVPVALEGTDDGRDVDLALPEGDVHPLPHGVGVGGPTRLDAAGEVEADVLEVDVGDAVGVLDGHG